MFNSGELYLIPVTPLDQINLILDDVRHLIKSGILSDGQGSALKALLEAAINQMNQKNVNGSINELRAFISEVKARIKAGVLFKTEGEGLIDAANDIIMITHFNDSD